MDKNKEPTKEQEESEGDSDEESSEGEDEEEDEPKLKYQRLGADVLKILKEESASCLQVHERFLVLGTTEGRIYLLDFNGDQIKKIFAHTAKINDISIDDSGEYICSCSDDKKVSICGLFNGQLSEFAFRTPVLSVAIDPNYSKSSQRQFFCGEKSGNLIRSEKGWLKNHTTLMHSGEGAVHAISWRGSLVAWANDVGVKILDVETKERITFIERPKGSPRLELYRCYLCWETDTSLIIGWADSIKIAVIKERSGNAVGSGGSSLPSRYVEITGMFQINDVFISGIAPFGEYLILLAFLQKTKKSKKDGEDEVPTPELRIITRQNEEISYDALEINGYQNYHPTSYKLSHMSKESLFYIVAPKDVVIAKPRDLDDHISWLIQQGSSKRGTPALEEALQVAKENESVMKRHTFLDIGEKLLNGLIAKGDFTHAASLTPTILKRDPTLWEKWIMTFSNLNKLSAISPYIPIANPTLPPMIYELVLNSYLLNDHAGFSQLISEWPPTLYDISTVISTVQNRLQILSTLSKVPNVSPDLMDALAKLYSYQGSYDKTLHIYLRLGKKEAFDLIVKHDLFSAVKDQIILLLRCDQSRALEMFVNHTDKIPVHIVVEKLSVPQPSQGLNQEDMDKILLNYLHRLFIQFPQAFAAHKFAEVEPSATSADGSEAVWAGGEVDPSISLKLIRLYAQYQYDNLMPFLKSEGNYDLAEVLDLLKDPGKGLPPLYPEMVHILGKMGAAKKALTLIVEKIKSVEQAVVFVSEQKDKELWQDLLERSMKDASFVSGLLEHLGTVNSEEFVTPLDLITKIPLQMKIASLRDRLVKIISDYNLQMSLREGCNTILKKDCVDLIERQNRMNKKAIRVGTSGNNNNGNGMNNGGIGTRCMVCGEEKEKSGGGVEEGEGGGLKGKGGDKGGGWTVFWCHHVYHTRCLGQAAHGGEEGGEGGGGGDRNESQEARSMRLERGGGEGVVCVVCYQQKRRKSAIQEEEKKAASKEGGRKMLDYGFDMRV
eukprot:TRINITY_DN4223_c0_g1_i1.p1 TRINITY_DN4223_c0_g1~~TRINITY_DN4223_c0_g1_i1.p1  ORF type:complete len:1005 (-),score=309.56 TRINITY_DN4223_c0_g1_i1:127-3141(-)